MSKVNQQKQFKQWLIVGGFVVLVLAIFIGISMMSSRKQVNTHDATLQKASLSLAANENTVQDSLKAKLSQQETGLNTLQTQVDELKQTIQTQKDMISAQSNELETVKKTLNTYSAQQVSTIGTVSPTQQSIHAKTISLPTVVMKMQVFTPPKPKVKLKISDQVTAGTSAVALVLSGAATDAGANGQGNTIPIRLRIESDGRLPNGHRSSLKGCFLTASAYGSVSSERGEIRLQRLSCIRKDGRVIEKTVEGAVVDRSGMNGISGNTVMRNTPMLWNAGMAGFFSGIGSGLSNALTTTSISPLGSTNSLPSSELWKYGTYHGAGTALEKLSDYYIKLADLYHPVIEIHPGQFVGVFFLKGFSLAEDLEEETVDLTDKRDPRRAALPFFKGMKSTDKPSSSAMTNGSPALDVDFNRQFQLGSRINPGDNA